MFTFNFNFPITVSLLGSIGIFGIIVYVLKEPDKCEKVISLFCKLFRYFCSKAEEGFVKYSIQSEINSFTAQVKKDVPSLTVNKVRIDWVSEDITEEQFLKGGQLVMHMHKSRNDNRNLVNATLTFVSYSLLLKTKNYIAKYQKEAINLFAVTQILSKNHSDALGEFVDYYLSNAMDNNKINALYEKFDEIHKVGLFFPVFINEMNFLGEKVFGRAVKKDKIYAEVNELANFLFRYANRKINEETTSMEYTGTHCKFAIRLIGKSWKIDQEGEHIYINNIQKVYSSVETIYLLGNATHQGFIENVVKILLPNINYRVYNKKTFEAQIKDCSGNDFSVSNFLVILRNNIVTTFHKK